MKKLSILFSVGLLIFSLSCSEDTPTEPQNNPPKIISITVSPPEIKIDETISLSCVATDADGDDLTYIWSSDFGTFPDGASGPSVNWKAPSVDGVFNIIVVVSDVKETAQTEKIIIINSNNSLSGIITLKDKSLPISDVKIEVGELSTFSKEDGSYIIESIPSGEITIKASKLDYEIFEKPITISASESAIQNIEMIGSIKISGKVSNS